VLRVAPATCALICARSELDAIGIREILLRFGMRATSQPAERAVQRVCDRDVDVLLVDVSVQGFRSLIDAARQVGVPSVAFGGTGDSDTALRAIRAGCRGYIDREEPAEKWAEAATVTVNGGTYLSSAMITRLVEAYQGIEPLSAVIDHRLTEREWEILGLVAQGKTNKQVALELFISTETVRTHVSNILEKLDAPNRSAAAAKYHTLAHAS
jgi:DNA-binding NarL/FixJ family response regulator